MQDEAKAKAKGKGKGKARRRKLRDDGEIVKRKDAQNFSDEEELAPDDAPKSIQAPPLPASQPALQILG